MGANGRQNFVGVARRMNMAARPAWKAGASPKLYAALCVLALAVNYSCTARKGFSGRTLRIGFADSAPYYMISPDGSPKGLAVDLIREAARRQRIALQWIDARPWFSRVDKTEFAAEYLLSHNFIDLWPVAGIARQRLALAHIGPPWLQNSSSSSPGRPLPLTLPHKLKTSGLPICPGPPLRCPANSWEKSHLIVATTYNGLISQVCTGASDAAFMEGRALERFCWSVPRNAPIRS
jgi:hypothetical protein